AASGGAALPVLAGLLAVLGIAVFNAILLIRRYQNLERHEGEALGAGLAVRGATERLSPVLSTLLASGIALVPVLVMGVLPGLEIVRPTALVIVAGLVTTALLDLLLLPAMFLRLGVSSVQVRDPMAEDSVDRGPA